MASVTVSALAASVPTSHQVRLAPGRALWAAWVHQCQGLLADPAAALVALWAVFWHRCWAQDGLMVHLQDARNGAGPAPGVQHQMAVPALVVQSVLMADAAWPAAVRPLDAR